jgi:hypothetical protein
MVKLIGITGREYEVDTGHRLAGKRAIKRAWSLKGCQIEILGIRAGAKDSDRFAFVARYGQEIFLISRRDFKVVNR